MPAIARLNRVLHGNGSAADQQARLQNGGSVAALQQICTVDSGYF
jgi:hypothetical protein